MEHVPSVPQELEESVPNLANAKAEETRLVREEAEKMALRSKYVIGRSCYAPVISHEGVMRTATCYYKVCDWTLTYGDGNLDIHQVQRQHDTAEAQILL